MSRSDPCSVAGVCQLYQDHRKQPALHWENGPPEPEKFGDYILWVVGSTCDGHDRYASHQIRNEWVDQQDMSKNIQGRSTRPRK